MAFFQYAPGARPDLELVCQLVARLVPIKFLIRLKKDDLPCLGTAVIASAWMNLLNQNLTSCYHFPFHDVPTN